MPDDRLPLLLYGDSYRFPDVYHATRFLAPDPFITLEQDSERVIVTNSMELGRARKESRATSVHNVDEFGARDLMAAGKAADDVTIGVIAALLAKRGLGRVAVPRYFPIAIADGLRRAGIELVIATGLDERRRAKRDDELAAIEQAQRATERSFDAAVEALHRATEQRDGTLALDGDVLTAERLRAVIERTLLDLGCSADATIVAPGTQAADPHSIGTGPLRAGESIVLDIFPQHKTSRYWADMTRTVSKGRPSDAIVRMYDVVRRAQDLGIAALRPGVTGREVHEQVEDVIYGAGYETLRPEHKRNKTDPITRGLIHGTGHGVGLEIHEAPSVGRMGSKPLQIGDVVTVEPGIYDPDVGGVRLEDMLVITAEGYRNLTRSPRELVL